MPNVWQLEWEEVRTGQESLPFGCSYHLTKEDAASFVEAYWTDLSSRVANLNPELKADDFDPMDYFQTFSRPVKESGKEVSVDVKLFNQINAEAGKYGIRRH